MSNRALSHALIKYIGYKNAKIPQNNASAVASEFCNSADLLIEEINEILNELNSLQPDWELHSLDSAEKWAGRVMKERHPDLDDEALSALQWAFTWWWR